jgi:hypothetical protein
MSYRDQKKYFEALARFERKMGPKEREDYKMLLKRHKDDEDLDRLSMERLKKLYEKYYVNREKPDISSLFKNKDN